MNSEYTASFNTVLMHMAWIEPIGGSYVMRQRYRRWATYDETLECFVTSSGATYCRDAYGHQYIAFAKPCTYSKEIIY